MVDTLSQEKQSYLVGSNFYNVWLIKTYADGTMEWDQTLGTIYHDIGYSVQQTNDGGYIIAGETYMGGNRIDVLLIKTYADGTMEWDQTFGEYDDKDIGYSVQQTDDGGYIIAGAARTPGQFWDGLLIKTDLNGYEMWNQSFGDGGHDYCRSVLQADDGSYIATGYTDSYAGADHDVWLIKYDAETVNHPPETPDAPDGPSEGGSMVFYDFTAWTTDPEEDLISYQFDWGNGHLSYWTVAIPSGENITVHGRWHTPGFFDVRVRARDSLMNESNWSEPHTIYIINNPPVTPYAPTGPYSGAPGFEYVFSAHTTDPNGHKIAFNFSWGNGEYSGWTEFEYSGLVDVPYSWDETGTYQVQVQARDEWNVTDWSPPHTIVIDNQAPELPEIDGPTEGFVGDEQTFSIVSSDLDGHQLYYYVDWDDGSSLEEFGPYNSSVPFDASHTWDTADDYQISVIADDTYDESSVGTHDIEMVSKLEIVNITGGIRTGSSSVSAVIKNIGDTPASNIDWSITLEGGIILKGAETNDTITSLGPGEEVTVKSDIIIGFGGFLRPLTITVEAREEGGSSCVGTATGRVFIILLSVS